MADFLTSNRPQPISPIKIQPCSSPGLQESFEESPSKGF